MEVSLLMYTLEFSTRRAATAVMVYWGSYRGLFGSEFNQAAANKQRNRRSRRDRVIKPTLTPSGYTVIYIYLITGSKYISQC